MNTLNRVLDHAKQACNLPSDNALAERIGVSRSAVSLWRKGRPITEIHLANLIALAGVDPEMAVKVLAEQATTKAEKAVWGSLLDRLRPVAAVAGLVVLGMGWSADGRSTALSTEAARSAHVLYIMRSLMAWTRRLLGWLARNRRAFHDRPSPVLA